ncbi:uncharacterized protein BDZ83DRAFT_389004 [Colletotrichum acutatum]|uniref:Uncharacterized protein n=1 Tax=Glomerella acutata TaxID=27357 RepID=A0AAD8UL31_GLOAC|nr:uncharacterized protein BDZ83DRAFT_389004 [Colletotrichum acutatum]KAK1723518.1 hypothetical protein BDZ83DRAFT_389004 [Colletotrichum acutatum]
MRGNVRWIGDESRNPTSKVRILDGEAQTRRLSWALSHSRGGQTGMRLWESATKLTKDEGCAPRLRRKVGQMHLPSEAQLNTHGNSFPSARKAERGRKFIGPDVMFSFSARQAVGQGRTGQQETRSTLARLENIGKRQQVADRQRSLICCKSYMSCALWGADFDVQPAASKTAGGISCISCEARTVFVHPDHLRNKDLEGQYLTT